jgi:hypothetical protein
MKYYKISEEDLDLLVLARSFICHDQWCDECTNLDEFDDAIDRIKSENEIMDEQNEHH